MLRWSVSPILPCVRSDSTCSEKPLELDRPGRVYQNAQVCGDGEFVAAVVQLEEEWGDHLVSKRENDAAISHFIEAGKTIKALDAAVHARQWKKAMQIVQVGRSCVSEAERNAPLGV